MLHGTTNNAVICNIATGSWRHVSGGGRNGLKTEDVLNSIGVFSKEPVKIH
jgi:hypothetical protein